MAEGLARAILAPGFRVHSAGSSPAQLNPFAVAALRDRGIDISTQRSKGLDEVPLDEMHTVITLCEEEVCPRLPEHTTHLHWPEPDPASARGTDGDKLDAFRAVRDGIEQRLRAWAAAEGHALR